MKLDRSFKKEERLKNKKDFNKVFNDGKKIKKRYYLCFFLKNNINNNRIGLIVKKRIGNSVKRNYEKRILREFYKEFRNELNNYFDMIFILLRPDGDFLDKREDFKRILIYIQKNDK
jgi:ribonuclease P protein component